MTENINIKNAAIAESFLRTCVVDPDVKSALKRSDRTFLEIKFPDSGQRVRSSVEVAGMLNTTVENVETRLVDIYVEVYTQTDYGRAYEAFQEDYRAECREACPINGAA